MQNYNFNDALASFAQYVFKIHHLANFNERNKKIQDCLATGVELTKYDKMKEGDQDFNKLSLIEQEMFMEISRSDFAEVVSRLEKKGLPESEYKIQRV